MAENKTVDKEKYLDEIEDSIRTIGVLTSGGDAPGMIFMLSSHTM